MSGRPSAAAPARRRHDSEASRQALLEAAGALFEERGYEAATVREIGERARVDPALIARYFGSKEGLYLASLTQQRLRPVPADPVEALAAMLGRSEARGIGPVARAMVSPTLTEPVRQQIQGILRRRLIEPLAAELGARGVPEPELRAEVLVALAAGVSLIRAGGTLPALTDTQLPQLLEVLEPLINALQSGVR